MLQSQNYGLQQLTKLEGSMCTQKTVEDYDVDET